MIKFVYFDLGGVVIKDFSGTDKWEVFKKDFNLTDEYWDKHEPEFDRGEPLPDQGLVTEFVKRFEKNESILPVLKLAESKFKVGLLTNMYPGMFKEIANHFLLPEISWETIVDSSIEKVGKPDRKIFEIAQERSGVGKDEILFVENSSENVDEAKKFGWQTFLYDSNNYKESSEKLYNFLENEN